MENINNNLKDKMSLLYLQLQNLFNSRKKRKKSKWRVTTPDKIFWNKTEKFGNVKQNKKKLMFTFACS